jgi:hypothetical protein
MIPPPTAAQKPPIVGFDNTQEPRRYQVQSQRCQAEPFCCQLVSSKVLRRSFRVPIGTSKMPGRSFSPTAGTSKVPDRTFGVPIGGSEHRIATFEIPAYFCRLCSSRVTLVKRTHRQTGRNSCRRRHPHPVPKLRPCKDDIPPTNVSRRQIFILE